MTIERTFQQLQQRLRDLEEALDALGTTVEQDRPTGGDVVVATQLDDAVLAARGYLQESLTAAGEASEGVALSFDTSRTQRALTHCQERLHELARYFASELTSFDRLDDIRSVGRERGKDWLTWATVVTQELDLCRTLLEEARSAVFTCWQHLTERMTSTPVVVRAVGANPESRQSGSLRGMQGQGGLQEPPRGVR